MVDIQLKTAFNGYDKKAVEVYIEELNHAHEKEVEELKAQIEKMKCCGNCKHQKYDYESKYCEFDATREKECVNLSEWELAE